MQISAEPEHRRTREWKFRSETELETQIQMLALDTGLSPITLRVCLSRGLHSAETIRAFLNPKLEALTDPLKLKDMDKALDRLCQARATQEMIRVYGDYDVDGTTGAALLSLMFRDFGFSHDVRQPDRFRDGYGLNPKAVEEAAQAGIRLMVTVDCGISSFDAAAKAIELGVELIIVDHHQLDPVRGLPAAVAVINPQRPDCESGLKQLCGCGLAFFLARALRTRGRDLGWWTEASAPNLKQHLDLVVMATAADMVPLTGDNHILVRHGLQVLKQSRKPGIQALLEAAGLGTRDISPGHLGFVIGPRINASGRLGSASLALELLTTQDSARGCELAQTLEKINRERAEIQNLIWDQVRARVEAGLAEGKFRHGIVVADPSWHEGVVGIVASRVTETFRKPAAVIALREAEGFGKGSVRSYGGKDVLAALRESAASLLGFGGHKHAAGLSVSIEKVEELAAAFDAALESLKEDRELLPLWIEGSCLIDELTVPVLQELENLGPFGPGNPEPVFRVEAHAIGRQVLKGRHLKLQLSGNSASFSCMEAIWFHAAEREDLVAPGVLETTAEWAAVPELNRFRGRVTPTLRVRDWRKLPTSPDVGHA